MGDPRDENEFEPNKFYKQLIRPQTFQRKQLITNKNQVAGHTGFYSLNDESGLCLKPFNKKCLRGRREHLFYQLIEYFKRYSTSTTNLKSDSVSSSSEPATLLYKQFTLLTYPSPATKCNCIIDGALFKLLSSFVANFYHVKHLSIYDGDRTPESAGKEKLLETIYSEQSTCPCYGRDPKEKSSCSRDYDKIDFLCLQDLTSQCREPCIIDIKIGQITYDPLAIKEKVLEQSSKYRRLREFGFRILGMKLGDQVKDKSYGKTLETTEQVYEALDSFFVPLRGTSFKSVVISQILCRLQSLLVWFEEHNCKQLKFFSSSLLIVYDSFRDNNKPTSVIEEEMVKNVRVSMIDFAHVFHVHEATIEAPDENKDDNYIFGLRKLEQFFVTLSENQ